MKNCQFRENYAQPLLVLQLSLRRLKRVNLKKPTQNQEY